MANRWLSRLAAAAAISDAGSEADLRCPVRLTGVPVRRAFFDSPRLAEDRPDGGLRVLVLGGSQGAETLNRIVPDALRRFAEACGKPPTVLHQAGAGKALATEETYRDLGLEARVVEFLDDMPSAVAEADLVLCRAGAITLAEVCAAGRPSLLFPLAAAAGHQAENARSLERAGAARVFEVPDAGEVAAVMGELLAPHRLVAMAAAARGLARPGAANAIADLVEEVAC